MRQVTGLLLCTAALLQADELTVRWELPGTGAEVRRSPMGGEYFHIDGVPDCSRPGDPSLPLAPLYAVLPAGAVVDCVRLTGSVTEAFPGTVDLKAAQPGVPLSRPWDFVPVEGDRAAWAGLEFPVVSAVSQGDLMGYRLAGFCFRPVTWDPVDGTASVFTSAEFTVEYHQGPAVCTPRFRSRSGEEVAAAMVRSLVLNPGDINGTGAVVVSPGELEYGDYLIIAPDALASCFEPLAEWKTLKGVPASIVTMSWVDDNYNGVDMAQKIRFFLRDIYDSSPPTYVLLAGDTPGVSHRNCWATAEGYVGDPAADIYYQDMNDTAPGVDMWDANLDGVWGVIGEDVMDYHPDYIIGRAPVETAAEADIFVGKVIAYEDGCDSDAWYLSMGFTTGILWYSPYCPGSAGKEKVDTLYTPPAWTIEKHYESAGTQSYALTMDMLNRGQHLVNHACHGNTTSVSIGNGSLGISDFMGLTNISGCDRPSIWNSVACNCGGFDQGACLAEAWIESPGGGGFCMMNSRYGWGEPSEPGDQWSDLVDQEFFAKFFLDDLYHLGEAHAMAKDEFVALIPTDTHYDWIDKSLTLFGDPELPIWNAVPDGDLEFEVSPLPLYAGMPSISVTVSDWSGPLQDARVCILQGEWDDRTEYGVVYTDASGTAVYDFSGGGLQAIPDSLTVTAWARNQSPVSQDLPILNTGISEESVGPGAVTYLLAPVPNPASSSVTFVWGVGTDCQGTLCVHDITGRTVAVLGSELEGSGSTCWDMRTESGQALPSGLYFARLSAPGSGTFTRRLVVVH